MGGVIEEATEGAGQWVTRSSSSHRIPGAAADMAHIGVAGLMLPRNSGVRV